MGPSHADLEFAAKVAATPLPPEDDEHFPLLLKAKAQAEIQRRQARSDAESSLYYFAKEVLGYQDFYEPLHKPFCDFIQQPSKQLTLIPRGHFKSTVISVSYPLWLLVNHPDVRILIANATLDNPRKFVQEQLGHIRSNRVFRWLFPESCPPDDEAEQFGFVASYTVPNREANWGEASVEVTSVDRNVVSRHY